jgi:hypothetical protein
MPENETLLYDAKSASRWRPIRRYLKATEQQIRMHAEVYRRCRREWLLLIADARRRNFPWISPARSQAALDGANA